MQEINTLTYKQPRNFELLANGVALGARDDLLCSDLAGREDVPHLRRQNQQILIAWGGGHHRLRQAFHIAADPWISDSTQIERNFHREPLSARQPTAGWALVP